MNIKPRMPAHRKNKLLKFIFLALVFCSSSLAHFAQARKVDSYPVPSNKKHLLFFLQRTKDANTVVYELNYKQGKLDEHNPVKAYWIRYAEHSEIKELSSIQKKFAFGVKSKKLNDGSFLLTFAAYDKMPILLKPSPTNDFLAQITIDKQDIILNRIYIHVLPGGSLWSPKIDYIEFKGTCAKSGKSVIKQIKP
jgi:hypothetical protein